MSARVLHGFRTGFARVLKMPCTGFARVLGELLKTRAADNLLIRNDNSERTYTAGARAPLLRRGESRAGKPCTCSARLFPEAFAGALASAKTHALGERS